MIFECDCPNCELHFDSVLDDMEYLKCPGCQYTFDLVDLMDFTNTIIAEVN